jgi:hypothetical protein
MGWIGCVHCEKFRCVFFAQTCAIIALVRSVLRRSSCSNDTGRNALKYEFGSNRVDLVCSLQKILTRLRCTNLCINSTSSAHFHRCLCSNETVRNTQIYEFGVQWGGSGAFVNCEKFRRVFDARTCALMAPFQPVLHRSSCSNETVRDPAKYEFGVQCGESGVFIANFYVTSWHEFVH